MVGCLVSWGLFGLGFGVVFLAQMGWVAEGFCEFLVTCRPEFARGCMGDATRKDWATKKRRN